MTVQPQPLAPGIYGVIGRAVKVNQHVTGGAGRLEAFQLP